jgi:hypothetical protein
MPPEKNIGVAVFVTAQACRTTELAKASAFACGSGGPRLLLYGLRNGEFW